MEGRESRESEGGQVPCGPGKLVRSTNICASPSVHPAERSPHLPGEGQVLACAVLCLPVRPGTAHELKLKQAREGEVTGGGAAQQPRESQPPFDQAQNLVKSIQGCKDETQGRTGQSVRGLEVTAMGTLRAPFRRRLVPQQLAGCTLRAVHAL